MNSNSRSFIEDATVTTLLYQRIFPHHKATAPHLVLIHGWGFCSSVWLSAIERLNNHFSISIIDLPGYGKSIFRDNDYDLSLLLPRLLEILPEQAIYCGWSLGANIVLQLAKRYPARVQGIISIASNPVFIQQDDWPGIDRTLFEQFQENLELQGEVFLNRFAGLCAQGADNKRKVWLELRQILQQNTAQPSTITTALKESLALTAKIDNRDVINSLRLPQLHIFAARDQLSSPQLAAAVRQLNPKIKCVEMSQAPHAVLLSHCEELWTQVLNFCQQLDVGFEGAGLGIDKQMMRSSFDQAATSYDSVAFVQREVVKCLLQQLPSQRHLQLKHVLDLGCGTGYALAALCKAMPQAQCYALDISVAMLQQANASLMVHGGCFFSAADFDALPYADKSFDLIFSSLALQWSQDLTTSLMESDRVLKLGGYCIFATLLADTLHELRAAWEYVDAHKTRAATHVNHFLDVQQLRDHIARSGFKLRQLRVKNHTRFYPRALMLMRELKSIGARNVNIDRPKSLLGKQTLAMLEQGYEKFRQQRGLPATYQVAYVVLEKTEHHEQ